MEKKVVFLFIVLLTLPSVGNAGDPNLVSHWRFDEGSGVIAYDSVGGNNGTIYGAKWTSNGKFGGALVFYGYNDYVNIGNLGITGDWTVTFWAKSSNNTGNV